jgi:hypothetical protein
MIWRGHNGSIDLDRFRFTGFEEILEGIKVSNPDRLRELLSRWSWIDDACESGLWFFENVLRMSFSNQSGCADNRLGINMDRYGHLQC